MNLVIRRVLAAPAVAQYYGVSPAAVLADIAAQEALFNRIFPPQVEKGGGRPVAFDWMLSRTWDAPETSPTWAVGKIPRRCSWSINSPTWKCSERLWLHAGSWERRASFEEQPTPRTDTWTVRPEKEEIPLHSLSANGTTSSQRTGWDSNPRYAINVHTLSRRAP